MNNIRLLISLVRANPGYAVIALTFDMAIGAIVATVVYVLLNSANVNPNTQSVLIFSAILVIVGMYGVGYTLLKSRLGITRGEDDSIDDEFDGNYDNWMDDADAEED